MIQGIFYARFDPNKGTEIVAQSPPGCIKPDADSPTQRRTCLFDFDVLTEYIIPRKGFVNRYIAVNAPCSDPSSAGAKKYSVLGFPVAIADPNYPRNEFIFNFGLVVEHAGPGADGGGGGGGDQLPYERVVRRLAVTFAEMEKQDGYLSRDDEEREAGRRPIASLLEIIKEDLNNYGECMIPVDDANTINMKLFPHHRAPPAVKGWHVPVAKMKFADIMDPTWDLTLQKVVARIDGVSDVRRIAAAADVSLDLAALALRHLLYYDTILLLDMFFFGNCYAPRPAIHDFVANAGGAPAGSDGDGGSAWFTSGGGGGEDAGGDGAGPAPTAAAAAAAGGGGGGGGGASGGGVANPGKIGIGIVDECANYVCIMSSGQRVSNYQLIKLLTSFSVGRSVAEWLRLHMDAGFDVLRYVDVRRLVQFGVIKGLLYRVHKYVVSKQYIAGLATGVHHHHSKGKGKGKAKGNGGGADNDDDDDGGGVFQRYMDGAHCFDQVVTEMNLTEAGIMERLKGFSAPAGDLTVLYR